MEEKFPKVIYAYAVLLDNKIENWKISTNNLKSAYEFNGFWKKDRIMDYKLQKVFWICKNQEEIDKVFEVLGQKWLKTWKHSSDYSLVKAY